MWRELRGLVVAGTSVDITGGDSVYCINQRQLEEAFRLAESDEESGPRIQALLEQIETGLTRNERAALCFVLIDRLLKTPTNA